MENNLSKAISQIKFPVRYDNVGCRILDQDSSAVVLIAAWYMAALNEQPIIDAFGHALAEIINGLDGRGKLAEKIETFKQLHRSGIIKIQKGREDDLYTLLNQIEIAASGRGNLPTDEELDAAAIDFVNEHCNNLSGDLTQETECFDAGAIWMRNKLLNSKPDRQVKSAEEIIKSINNAEWDDEGEPLYSYESFKEAMEIYAQQYK